MNYTYDVLNRLSTVAEASTGTTSYVYDAAGNLASFATPNGVAHAYTYDSRNRLTNLAVGTLASYAYTLDAAGHRTSLTELSSRTVNYTYDALYRLTSEAISGVGSVSYIYDPVGNRKQTTSTIAQIPAGLFNYDANDRLSTDTYDANGNTVSSGGTGNVYDFENRLISHGAVTMVYDGDGNRVAKTASGITTRYLVDDLNPTGFAQVIVESITNSAGEQRHYVYGLERLSQRRVFTLSGAPAETRFYGYDGHGSVRLLTDASGAVTDTYDYDAFGNLLSSTGLTPNNYRFAGEQFDFDLNLYYNRARYLNTSTGRFWTMDSFEGDPQSPVSLHRYLYAAADPVNQTDPSGKETLVGLSQATALVLGLAALSVAALLEVQTHAISNLVTATTGAAVDEFAENSLAVQRLILEAEVAVAAAYFVSVTDLITRAREQVRALSRQLRRGIPKVVPMPRSVIPDVADHVASAQASGQPQSLHRATPAQARTNRRLTRPGWSAGPGYQWDEYPFASSIEGGPGASVARVPERQNRIQGGIIAGSYLLQRITPNVEYFVPVIP